MLGGTTMAKAGWLMAGSLALALSAGSAWADPSPCQRSLDYLARQYAEDDATRAAFQATYEGLQPLPPGYSYGGSTDNPWASAGDGAGLAEAVGAFYQEVCTLLPQILGNNDNALDSIQRLVPGAPAAIRPMGVLS
jgi:hypothetical protein